MVSNVTEQSSFIPADYLVTASNGGSARPPGWLANVKARPECEIQVGRRKLAVRARATLPD
uniref:nitroreductase/quinone reductase family protein n=1 Tax=Nocardia abscessus TaxID=120957 RepID=UPI003CC7FD65